MNTIPHEEALRARWTLEGTIPLAGVAPDAMWQRARSVSTGEPVALFIVHGAAALEAADAARRAYLVEDPHLIPVRDVMVIDDPRDEEAQSPRAETAGSDGAGAGSVPLTVVEYPMPSAPPLAALLRGRTLHPETARSIVGEAARGLETARRRGVRHQFLDSNRVFVNTTSGEVTVLGVGVEAAAHPGLDRSGAVASFQDTHALVTLLYRALAGRSPHRGPDNIVPLPSTITQNPLPRDLDLLCDLVLNESADVFPESSRDLIAELEPWQSIPVTLEAYGHNGEPCADGSPTGAGTAAMGTAALAAGAGAAGAMSVEQADSPLAEKAHPVSSDPSAVTSPSDPGATPPAPAPSEPGHADQAQALIRELHLDQKRSDAAFPGRLDLVRAPLPRPVAAEQDKAEQDEAEHHDAPAVPLMPSRADGPAQPSAEDWSEQESQSSTPVSPDRTAVVEPVPAVEPSGPIVVRGRERSALEGVDLDTTVRTGRSALLRDVVSVAVDADESDTFAMEPLPVEQHSRIAQWILLGGVVVVIIAMVLALSTITSGFRDRVSNPLDTEPPETSQEESVGEDAGAEAVEEEPVEQEPAAPAAALQGVEVFTQGSDAEPDHADNASHLTDGDPGTVWSTKIYATPQYGGLKEGAGLRLDLGELSTLNAVVATTARNSGGVIELRMVGEDGSLGEVLATGEFGGDGEVRLAPPEPIEAQRVALWFPELPQDGERSGFRGRITEVRVE